MQYKTIILELLQQQPELHEQLRATRTLLSTLDQLASQLRAHHLDLAKHLRRQRPQTDATQLSNEAMEIAVNQFEQSLATTSVADDPETSLDQVMAYIKRHTPPA